MIASRANRLGSAEKGANRRSPLFQSSEKYHEQRVQKPQRDSAVEIFRDLQQTPITDSGRRSRGPAALQSKKSPFFLALGLFQDKREIRTAKGGSTRSRPQGGVWVPPAQVKRDAAGEKLNELLFLLTRGHQHPARADSEHLLELGGGKKKKK